MWLEQSVQLGLHVILYGVKSVKRGLSEIVKMEL